MVPALQASNWMQINSEDLVAPVETAEWLCKSVLTGWV